MTAIRDRTAKVKARSVLYRVAGAAKAPRLFLLHGIPTAGHMFSNAPPVVAK